MPTVLPPDVAGPNPGQPGHYAHHDWLTQSVHALDTAQQVVLPRARVYRAANLSVAHGGGGTVIPWDAETYDPNGMHAANATGIIVPSAGLYQIVGDVGFAGNVTGFRGAYIAVNAVILSRRYLPVAGAATATLGVMDEFVLNTNDVVTLIAEQTSGVALNVNGGTDQTFLIVRKVAA